MPLQYYYLGENTARRLNLTLDVTGSAERGAESGSGVRDAGLEAPSRNWLVLRPNGRADGKKSYERQLHRKTILMRQDSGLRSIIPQARRQGQYRPAVDIALWAVDWRNCRSNGGMPGSFLVDRPKNREALG